VKGDIVRLKGERIPSSDPPCNLPESSLIRFPSAGLHLSNRPFAPYLHRDVDLIEERNLNPRRDPDKHLSVAMFCLASRKSLIASGSLLLQVKGTPLSVGATSQVSFMYNPEAKRRGHLIK
jgi:hypothetical protein